MKKIALIVFVLSSLAVVITEIFTNDLLHMICKPLIMSSLLLYYIFSSNTENRSRVLILAILFSFAGDVLLMKPEYFISGLIAFLISHILYIFAYRQHQFDEAVNPLAGIQKIRMAFPIVLAGSGLVIILFPVLGDLKIPVIVYALVLVLMVLNALFRFGRTSQISFWMVFGGAVLFMISDSVLAINKFLNPFPLAGFWIMTTYTSAQYLIVKGLLLHATKQAKINF